MPSAAELAVAVVLASGVLFVAHRAMVLAWKKWFRLPWRTGKFHFQARLESDEEGMLVSVSHGQCHCIVDGAGNPGPLVVLVHGFIGSTQYLRFLAAALAKQGRRVLRFDLYGRGRSVLPGRKIPHTAGLFVGQLAELLFALGDEVGGNNPIDIIGYSMGGGIAAHFCATFPNRVRSVTFVAPVGLPSMRASFPWYLPFVLRIPLVRWLMARHLIDEHRALGGYCGGELLRWDEEEASVYYDAGWCSTDTPRFKEYSEREHQRFRHPDTVDVLARSIILTLAWFPFGELSKTFRKVSAAGVPALILWGDDDRLVDSAGAPELAALIPAAELRMLRGARHMVVVESEERVVHECVTFWDKVTRQPPRHVKQRACDLAKLRPDQSVERTN